MTPQDPRDYCTSRQAELLTERVESGAVWYARESNGGFSYEVSAVPDKDCVVKTIYVSQDDANTAYADAMVEWEERQNDLADSRNDYYNDEAMMREGR